MMDVMGGLKGNYRSEHNLKADAVETAEEMRATCPGCLCVAVFECVHAVFRVDANILSHKMLVIKKSDGVNPSK